MLSRRAGLSATAGLSCFVNVESGLVLRVNASEIATFGFLCPPVSPPPLKATWSEF